MGALNGRLSAARKVVDGEFANCAQVVLAGQSRPGASVCAIKLVNAAELKCPLLLCQCMIETLCWGARYVRGESRRASLGRLEWAYKVLSGYPSATLKVTDYLWVEKLKQVYY